MSKFVKKALKRVSWRPSDAPKYPITAPESPTETGFNPAVTNNINGFLGSQNRFESERPEVEEPAVEPITLAIIGGGQRGKARRFTFLSAFLTPVFT